MRKQSGIEEARKAIVRRDRNRIYKTKLRNAVKAVLKPGMSVEEMNEKFILAQTIIDKAAKKGIIHKNNAANKKSRMMKRINKLSQNTAG
jgi:small subunit ribosomal protein S20